MATYRLPGPTCAAGQTLLIDDGTTACQPGSRPGPLDGAVPGHASNHDPRTLWRRAEAVQEACAIALVRAPAAIVRATGLDDLPGLALGILEGMLGMLAFVAASALLGGAVGGVLGAVFGGGVGAVPGAALGAQFGTDAGMAVLAWMGLGFLIVTVGRGLGEVTGRVTIAVGQAWDAEDKPQRQRKVEVAGQLLADAVGQLMLLIVLAIVARLTAGQAASASARAAGSAEELYVALRASRLGAGFADWMKVNEARLLANPRLRMHNEVAGSSAKATETVTPSQLRSPRSQSDPTPEATTAGRENVPTATAQKAKGLPATTEASVEDKLQRYLLNKDHPVGGPKAKWFQEALGFTQENGSDLARQIRFDPVKAVATELTEHGQKFNQVTAITGANGKTIDVLFAWIRNEDGVVRLISGIPTKK